MLHNKFIKYSLSAVLVYFTASCSQETVSTKDLITISGVSCTLTDSLPFTGLCKDFYDNGQVQLEKNFIEGLPDGSFFRYYKNGQKSVEVNFVKGKPVGGYKQYYESGKLKAQKTDDGKKQIVTRWFENGTKSIEQHLENNILTGKSEQWYNNGQLELTSFYENDKRTGKFQVFFKDGKKKIEGDYIDGQLNGNWKVWNENQIVTSDETYVLGKKDGVWKYFYDNGKDKSVVIFKNGLVKQTKEWDENGKLINSFSSE